MVERVEMPAETPPEDQAHVDAMAAKGAALREGNPQPATTPTPQHKDDARPEWLPEKFKSPEDMAKAYSELEKKQGKPAVEPAADEQSDLTIPEGEAAAALEAKGIDMSALQAEYNENNGLTDETYERLEKAGLSRSDVNNYIAGQEALVAQVRSQAFATVGGEEVFTSMQEWAAANLNEQEKAAFNTAVKGDAASRDMAVRGLHAKYVDAVGSAGTQVHSNGNDLSAGDIFESRAQLTKAMSNEDYAKDPAYRKQVMDKLARTRSVSPLF